MLSVKGRVLAVQSELQAGQCQAGQCQAGTGAVGAWQPQLGLTFLPRAGQGRSCSLGTPLVLAPGMLWDPQPDPNLTVPEHPQPAAPLLLTAQ